MANRSRKPTCLSCRHYRPTDEVYGRCRLNKGTVDPSAYPVMKHEDWCEAWLDVGQKYHIRIGWLKGLKNKEADQAETDRNEVG